MDLVGPMGVSDRGNQYIMTIIYLFTRFLIIVPLKSKAATEVARGFFISLVCVHGSPKTIVTD